MRTKFYLSLLVIFMGWSISQAQTGRVPLPIMVEVDGGTFTMGSNTIANDELPAHKVTVSDFSIGKYEVTYSEFLRFVHATGYVLEADLPDSVRIKKGYQQRNIKEPLMDVKASDSMRPVGNINWFDAQAYIKWLNEMTGKNYRLPTEAEWEYAAKGGDKSKGYYYPGGSDLPNLSWYYANAKNKSHTVGQKTANELGIFDMSGNVREWCSDWYAEHYYKSSPATDPQGADLGRQRVLRGGSWVSNKDRMRTTYRNYDFPFNSHNDYGFRLVIAGVSKPKVKEIPTSAATAPKLDFLKDLDTKGFVDIYGIYFDTGKSKVKPEGYPVVDQIATYLKENPKTRLVVEGHTDNTGSAEKNLTLSENRAKSIKAELVKRGVDESRLETKGYGSTKPIGDNKTKEGRTQNRRVTITKL
jgi:formylglycine-generating enzyme